MPKVRRHQVPPALLDHLLLRIRQRSVSPDQINLLAVWLDTAPDVPDGKWFKTFPGFIVCGEGELIKTFLLSGQLPDGREVH